MPIYSLSLYHTYNSLEGGILTISCYFYNKMITTYRTKFFIAIAKFLKKWTVNKGAMKTSPVNGHTSLVEIGGSQAVMLLCLAGVMFFCQ